MYIPKIPLADWIDSGVDFLVVKFGLFFDFISFCLSWFVVLFVLSLGAVHPLLLIAAIALIAYALSSWKAALFTAAGLLLIYNLGYWTGMIDTLALVLTSVVISIIVGVPVGIWMSQSDGAQRVITPVLDFMQTMPAFVYLIPAILFFGIGLVPGIISSVIFAMPPTIRLTNLGIRQVPEDLVEAADAFGSTEMQKLFKVQLPLAMPTIMAGINQSIMLSLSMVVTASLVGAPGIGADVYRAVTQVKVGLGFEAGLAIVILAIILDRLSQNIGFKRKKRRG